METIDLQFFLEPPELTVKGLLIIEALAPLSMVAAQPGAYYRTQSIPTNEMVYGMLENALGWHFGSMNLQIIEEESKKYDREKLIKKLKSIAFKRFKKNEQWKSSKWLTEDPLKSGSGFMSLLTYHVSLNLKSDLEQMFLQYDDLWTRHINAGVSGRFENSSRNHDFRIAEVRERIARKTLQFDDKSEKKKDGEDEKIVNNEAHPEKIDKKNECRLTVEEMLAVPDKTTLHKRHLKPFFPFYYNSPTLRGYVVPSKPYVFEIVTTTELKNLLFEAIRNPQSPLYLGSNDGWVEATLQWID